MEKFEVDFDVWQVLTSRRKSEQDTNNDVLRRILDLPPKAANVEDKPHNGKSWVTKNVSIPEGTEFRALYKNNYYYGKVDDGALVIDGKSFTSSSKAARHITGNSVNGWIFWECKLPGKNSFQIMSSLRK